MVMQQDKDKSFFYPFGITVTPSGFYIKVIRKCEKLYFNLYIRNEKSCIKKIEFPKESRIGDVWFLKGDIRLKKNHEYALEDEKGVFPDEYGRYFSGRDSFGKESLIDNPMRSPVYISDFDWGEDAGFVKEIESMDIRKAFIYRLHVRGFTKAANSKVVDKGTFKGLTKKIDYIKFLGVDVVDIMPATEFDEFIRVSGGWVSLFDKEKKEKIRTNYWGYTRSLNFAPKASFSTRRNRNPVNEYKAMVKAMHEAGIAVIQEFFFDNKKSLSYIIDVLRFWKSEYHIDGFHITGIDYNEAIVNDPYLLNTKFIFTNKIFGDISKNIISMNYEYMNNMRKYLKGDEGMIPFVSSAISDRNNYLNFIADINGFSLADVYSYDYKHNEDNGEENSDGSNMNFSWNCGFEGKTKKQQVLGLRKKMYLNAIFLLMISGGVLFINSGDEILQSKLGNNNTYCQDNEISWFDWKLVNKNKDFLNFFAAMLKFRREYFESEKLRLSIHGMQVWRPDFEYYNRQMGIFVEGERDVYIVLNMHWEKHDFFLPTTKRGSAWHLLMDTNNTNNPVKEETLTQRLENQRAITVLGRSCIVLIEKKEQKQNKGRVFDKNM